MNKYLKTLWAIIFIALLIGGCTLGVNESTSQNDTTLPNLVVEAVEEHLVEEPQPFFAVVEDIEGTVLGRQSLTDEYVTLENGEQIYPGGQLQTLEDSRALLAFSDGTIVRIGPATTFSLESIEEEELGLANSFLLEVGQLWVILNGGTVAVDTPSGVASVRGSYLSVEYDDITGMLRLTCLEGDCVHEDENGSSAFTAGEMILVEAFGFSPLFSEMGLAEFEAWLNSSPEALSMLMSFEYCAHVLDLPEPSIADLIACFNQLGNDISPPGAVIGDWVWLDGNQNGIQDQDEIGVPEVLVELIDADGQLVASGWTDADGYYAFEEIPEGVYYLVFTPPDGFNFSLVTAGEDDSLDSDTDENGVTAAFAVSPGESNLSVDAGLTVPSVGAVCPLTGLEVDDPSLLDLRPIFVSISHFPPLATRPPTGISWAPMVYELFIGEGQTRLFALFYCGYPEIVESTGDGGTASVDVRIEGVRSGRVAYGDIAQFFGAGMIIGGADPSVRAEIAAAVCGSAYTNDPDDIGAGGLNVTRLQEIAEECASELGNTDLAVYEFGPAPASGESAPSLLMFYNYLNQTRWVYDPALGGYVRYQNVVTSPEEFELSVDRLTGEPLVRQNVIVLSVPHTVYNTAGTIIGLELEFARGYGRLFRDGQLYDICWTTIPGDYETTSDRFRPILFTDCAGNVIPLAAGTTWVNLVDTSYSFYFNGTDWFARFYTP